MERYNTFRTGSTPAGRRVAILLTFAIAPFSLGSAANAQSRTMRDIATAYGARLNAKGEPANLNPSRINNRVNSRLDWRLSVRVERYRPNSFSDPAAAFAVQPMNNAQVRPETAPSPLSTSSQGNLILSLQTSSRLSDYNAQPR